MKETEIEKMFYSINEFSKLTSISEPGIRSKIFRNEIPTIKMGGRILIPAEFVNNLINRINTEDTINKSNQF